MRILVIVNPRATTTTAHERDVLAHALGESAELRVEQTQNRGHAAALACRAMRDGTDAVVALGGDGTVNEVVNGLLTDGIHDRVPALGVIPGGATNVFARALGLPNDPVEATGILLEALRGDRRRAVSLGRADDRWFIFAAGVGFDASIIARVDKHRGRGRRSSELLYARAGVREFFAADRRHPRLHLSTAGAPTFDGLYYAVIANTDPWTYIGSRGLHPTPEASFDTDLDVFARTRMGLPGVVLTLAQMSRRAPRPSRMGSIVRHDLAELIISCDQPTLLQVDGELVGPCETVKFTSFRRAIQVIV